MFEVLKGKIAEWETPAVMAENERLKKEYREKFPEDFVEYDDVLACLEDETLDKNARWGYLENQLQDTLRRIYYKLGVYTEDELQQELDMLRKLWELGRAIEALQEE